MISVSAHVLGETNAKVELDMQGVFLGNHLRKIQERGVGNKQQELSDPWCIWHLWNESRKEGGLSKGSFSLATILRKSWPGWTRAKTAYRSKHQAGTTQPSSLICSAIHLQQPRERSLGTNTMADKRCWQLEAVWWFISLKQFPLKEDLSSVPSWLR